MEAWNYVALLEKLKLRRPSWVGQRVPVFVLNRESLLSLASLQLQNKCDGNSKCSISVTSDALGGNPCYGTWKYLEVRFTCIVV